MQYANGIQTKQQILQITKKLMRSNGYKATTYQMIAQEAGVPVGLVNYHFKKTDFIKDIYSDFFQEISECIKVQAKKAYHNELLFHILESRIFMTQIITDPKTLAFHLEIHYSELIPGIILEKISKRLDSIIKGCRLEECSPELSYWYAVAENGAIKELMERNQHVAITDMDFEKFLDLIATIAVKLAGIDPEVVQMNLDEAVGLFRTMDYQHLHLL